MVADGPSKQSLVSYRIPLSLLVPFHQYHLECVMVSGINQLMDGFMEWWMDE